MEIKINTKTDLENITNDIQIYESIYLENILEDVHHEQLVQELFNIKSKLSKNGKLCIQGVDLYELSYAIVNDRISTIEYNKIISGKQQILCISDLISILNHLGFKIISKDIDALKFYIEAQNV